MSNSKLIGIYKKTIFIYKEIKTHFSKEIFFSFDFY